MKVLVCGGTGFVGSAIARELSRRHIGVRVLTRKSAGPDTSVEYVRGNVFDSTSLHWAMQGCDVVIQAVQFENAPFENPKKGRTYEKIDGEGTEAVVDAAKTSAVNRIIYVSGAGTDENKTEAWFRAKFRAEQAVKKSGLVWTIFRPSWIYGRYDRSLNRMINMIRWSPLVFILGGSYKIQPLLIDDFAKMLVQSLLEPDAQHQIYQVAGPQHLTMKEILQTAAKVLDKKRIYISIPNALAGFLFSCLGKRDALDFLTMDIFIPKDEEEKVVKDLKVECKTLQEGLQTYL
jgi:uncharacterized protein YbjT (DUF2867 family)